MAEQITPLFVPGASPGQVAAVEPVVFDLPSGKMGRERLLEIIRREIVTHTVGLPNVEYDAVMLPLPQPDGRILTGYFITITCNSPMVGEVLSVSTSIGHPRPRDADVRETLRQLGAALATGYHGQLQAPTPPPGTP